MWYLCRYGGCHDCSQNHICWNSAGVLLPKELLAKLRVEKGDMLHVIETENGIELTPYDPEFDAQMAVAEDIMREDRDILRKLAK
jgi:putative addiction module antidote